jgi:hypothetical protein
MDPIPAPAVTEDDVQADAPRARALALARLEMLWRVCLPHLNQDLDPNTDEYSRPDPRWAEIGIRIIDRINRLYRLDKPVVHADEDETSTDPERTRALITAGLDQLEAAVKAQENEPGTGPRG